MAILAVALAAAAEPSESQRMQRAKDLIADENWARAIVELRAAVNDAKETNKDEALFWLAQSLHESGDSAAALETILRLEKEYTRSRWIRPARSLRIEMAQRMRRSDVLWFWAMPPAPPAPPVPAAVPPAPPVADAPVPAPPVPAGRAPRNPPPPPAPPAPRPARGTPWLAPPPPLTPWVVDHFEPDMELRIQALGGLIQTQPETAGRVIPLLKEIALDAPNTAQARRALWAIGQSRRPEAQSIVLDVAKTGSEHAKLAAVRVLGTFEGVEVSNALLDVYSTGGEMVKFQVVTSLGERSAAAPLVRIVQSEPNPQLQERAIVTLGRVPGGRDHLRLLYDRVAFDMKRPIINGLFAARDEQGLIRIADRERQRILRRHVLERLKLLGTPGANAYLEKVKW